MARIQSPNWSSAANCTAAAIAFACIDRISPVDLISFFPSCTPSSSCMAASGTGMPARPVAQCRRPARTIGKQSSSEISDGIVPSADRSTRPDGECSSSGNVSLPLLVDYERLIGSFSSWTHRKTDIPRQRQRVLFGLPARPQLGIVPALRPADGSPLLDLLRQLRGGRQVIGPGVRLLAPLFGFQDKATRL